MIIVVKQKLTKTRLFSSCPNICYGSSVVIIEYFQNIASQLSESNVFKVHFGGVRFGNRVKLCVIVILLQILRERDNIMLI